jgi:hypothetical protein
VDREKKRLGVGRGQSLYRRRLMRTVLATMEILTAILFNICILRYTVRILVQYIDTKISDEHEASIIVANQQVGLN